LEHIVGYQQADIGHFARVLYVDNASKSSFIADDGDPTVTETLLRTLGPAAPMIEPLVRDVVFVA